MLLKADNISKIYKNGNKSFEVLKNIRFSIKAREIVAIVGPSGAGKSTLLHILAGLDKPTKGSVVFDGTDLYGLSDSRRSLVRNKRIGFVFQFYYLLSEFSVLENVMMPVMVSRDRDTRKNFSSDKANGLLSRVKIKGKADNRPSQISGGEAQRVAIARALINDPDIVFCDEPTGNLDSANAGIVLELIKDLNQKTKQAFLIVTHNEKVADFADRILHIEDGKIK
ncbi:MAG: ABC transporter ATP-binding protein [Candidatus Orphnella occulta]|nr:ABC transporter ATP-binding protein [Candidatus Orphnella occulta]